MSMPPTREGIVYQYFNINQHSFLNCYMDIKVSISPLFQISYQAVFLLNIFLCFIKTIIIFIINVYPMEIYPFILYEFSWLK